MLALLLLLSQKQDPSRNESYNLIKMCKCMELFLVDELLCMILLSSLFSVDVDYLSLLFFFDMPCGHVAYLLWVCIFISFCIAHILDGNLGERVMIELGVLFCEWMTVFAM